MKTVTPAVPFGMDFQGSLLKLLLSDPAFGRVVSMHIVPSFFQNEPMGWAWGVALKYREKYGHLPSYALLMNEVRTRDPQAQEVTWMTLEGLRRAPVTDEEFIRDKTIDFVRRCVFRQAHADSRDLFAAGQYDSAYDLMQTRMDALRSLSWEVVDRGWIAEEFEERIHKRADDFQTGQNLVGCGIAAVDKALDGGAYPGFLGCWIARPKRGKTTFLANIGAVAMRSYMKRVLHFVLEGKRQMVESRYDTIVTEELYTRVKRGDIDAEKYARAASEMKYLRGLGVTRGLTENWDNDILKLEAELKDLKNSFGFVPDVIVVDYADLMRSRNPSGKSETQQQVEAYKDLKSLMGHGPGYRGWTASQVQRPKDEDFDTDASKVLKSRDIADAYAKVRICDLVGSLNVTNQEMQQGVLRLYLELLRDGEADTLIPISAQFDRMTFGGGEAIMPGPDNGTPSKAFGYAPSAAVRAEQSAYSQTKITPTQKKG